MITLLKQIFGDKMKAPPMFFIRALIDNKNNSSKKLKAGATQEQNCLSNLVLPGLEIKRYIFNTNLTFITPYLN